MIDKLPINEEDVRDVIGTYFLLPPEIASQKTAEVFQAMNVVVQESIPATPNSTGSKRGVSIHLQGVSSGDTVWISIDDLNTQSWIVDTL